VSHHSTELQKIALNLRRDSVDYSNPFFFLIDDTSAPNSAQSSQPLLQFSTNASQRINSHFTVHSIFGRGRLAQLLSAAMAGPGDFIGLQMLVTTRNPPGQQLKGTVSELQEGAGLTLSNGQLWSPPRNVYQV